MMKRAFDCLMSLMGLICTSWLIFILVILIRLTSRGPGIFAQERVGLHERRFICYKLRTMYLDTPVGATHNTKASSVTKIGRLLRRLKLDELPQLWNVFKGDMSLVGPRPSLPLQVEVIAERRRRGVLNIRPGITGLAQIRGIDMSNPRYLAEVDAQYLADCSFFYDLTLILKTVAGRGAGDQIR